MYGLDQAKIDSGDKHLTVAANVIFAGFHRFAWALACAWVVFACCRGYGGIFFHCLRNMELLILKGFDNFALLSKRYETLESQ